MAPDGERTVVITGSSRGLGAALTRRFARDSWYVIASSRDVGAAGDERITNFRMDVRRPREIRRLGQALAGVPVDVLINNAAVYDADSDSWPDVDQETWSRTFMVNCIGPFLVTRALVESLRLAPRPVVVNISGLMGSIALNADGGHYAYRTSKAALNAVTRSMSADLADAGITTFALDPGWLDTDMGRSWTSPDPELRPTSPDTVADGLYALLSTAHPALNGTFVDRVGTQLPW